MLVEEFAVSFNISYASRVPKKLGIGIITPFFENRQSISLVYGGLLRAAHVADRFCFRGSDNLKQDTAIDARLSPGCGGENLKKTGIAMTISNRPFVLLCHGHNFLPPLARIERAYS